jgi:hypothetical protein
VTLNSAWSVKDDNHFAVGFAGLHHMMRHAYPPNRNDPFFLPAGAEAFRRDIPDADVRLLDTGHFALETHAREIAAAIRGFLTA